MAVDILLARDIDILLAKTEQRLTLAPFVRHTVRTYDDLKTNWFSQFE